MLWYSLEAPRRGASNEYPQHMISSRNKKKKYFLVEKRLIKSYGTNSLMNYIMEICLMVVSGNAKPSSSTLNKKMNHIKKKKKKKKKKCERDIRE